MSSVSVVWCGLCIDVFLSCFQFALATIVVSKFCIPKICQDEPLKLIYNISHFERCHPQRIVNSLFSVFYVIFLKPGEVFPVIFHTDPNLPSQGCLRIADPVNQDTLVLCRKGLAVWPGVANRNLPRQQKMERKWFGWNIGLPEMYQYV